MRNRVSPRRPFCFQFANREPRNDAREGNRLKTLGIQKVREGDYASITTQLEYLFYDIVFRPIVDILRPHSTQVHSIKKGFRRSLRNAEPTNEVVIAAINAGRIQYSAGVFSGDFNSTISKSLLRIGAKFSNKTFVISPDLIPPDIRAAAQNYHHAAVDVHDSLLDELDRIQAGLEGKIDKKPIDAGIMVDKVQKGFAKSVGDALGNTDLTDESRAKLKAQFAENLKPYIKQFSADTIQELREAVEANALTGYRFDNLLKRFQNRYDVSKSKAELLAQTETAHYVSLHQRARYEESGITKYIWRTAGDSRVRKDHQDLNGQIFFFKHPPVIDTRTGERGNPGMGIRCRCSAEAIISSYTDYTTPVENSAPARTNSKALEAVTC